MRLNLGCGGRKFPDWINVDKFAACGPDQVVDLEQFPWPWLDNAVDEVRMYHVLEHLGAQTEVYLGIIKELYRVCRDNAEIHIVVPHPRHDDFLNDPTRVRAVTPGALSLLSQANNRRWLATGAANTPLGLYLEVDFIVESESYHLEDPWDKLFEQGKLPLAELQQAIRMYGNVVKQFDFLLRPIKPAGRTAMAAAAEPAVEAPLVPDQATASVDREPLKTA
jgi:hypothetical protein